MQETKKAEAQDTSSEDGTVQSGAVKRRVTRTTTTCDCSMRLIQHHLLRCPRFHRACGSKCHVRPQKDVDVDLFTKNPRRSTPTRIANAIDEPANVFAEMAAGQTFSIDKKGVEIWEILKR